MARILPKKDVVIIGLGWTGSVMANELTDEGLDVIAIERGPWRDAPTDFNDVAPIALMISANLSVR
jgi:gluconate 2-dehydrogenase alpha chain